jgi:lysozyme family protein
MGKFDALVEDIIRRETGGRPNGGYTNDPSDSGGRTQYGIAETHNPDLWADGKVTLEEAKARFERKYIRFPKFDQIPDSHHALRHQLIDWSVTSGHFLVIQHLQKVLGTKQDGILGPQTLGLLSTTDPAVVNNALVKERVKMYGRIPVARPSQLKYLIGWLDRALDFLV